MVGRLFAELWPVRPSLPAASRLSTNIADANDDSFGELFRAWRTTESSSITSEEWTGDEDDSPVHRMAGAAATEPIRAANVTIVFMVDFVKILEN